MVHMPALDITTLFEVDFDPVSTELTELLK